MHFRDDVWRGLNDIKSKEAGVHDLVSTTMLKICMPMLRAYITHIFNACLEIRKFPNIWKTPKIYPKKCVLYQGFSD